MQPELPTRSIVLTVVGVLVALCVLGSVGWQLAGGSMFSIATPSMCPDLCVGTLVFDQPLHGPPHVGDVITFRPPGTSRVYTHRVMRVLPGGAFKTAGDAVGRVDPWTVPPSNVLGRVVGNVRGAGWLWRSLPWMAAALACALFLRRAVAERLRMHADVLFVTLLVVVPVLVLRPLVRLAVISWAERRNGSVIMTVANVGLLPVQLQATGGPSVHAVPPGQIVTAFASRGAGGAVSVQEIVSLSALQWAVAAGIVLLPLAGLLVQIFWHRRGGRRVVLRPVPVAAVPELVGWMGPFDPRLPGAWRDAVGRLAPKAPPPQPLRWRRGARATQARLAADPRGPGGGGHRPHAPGLDVPGGGQFVAAGPEGAALGAPGR
ncbi:MAG: S26 family signal peptidase [Acidimicrobiales bacterium]